MANKTTRANELNNTGAASSPASPSGNAELELLKGLGIVLDPTKPVARPKSQRGGGGREPKPMDAVVASRLDTSLSLFKAGDDNNAMLFVGTNRVYTNDTTNTFAKWQTQQVLQGVYVKVASGQHDQSPNPRTTDADGADKPIIRNYWVVGMTDDDKRKWNAAHEGKAELQIPVPELATA